MLNGCPSKNVPFLRKIIFFCWIFGTFCRKNPSSMLKACSIVQGPPCSGRMSASGTVLSPAARGCGAARRDATHAIVFRLGLIIALALMLVPHPQVEAQNNACLAAIVACAAAQAHEEHVRGNSPRSADCWWARVLAAVACAVKDELCD